MNFGSFSRIDTKNIEKQQRQLCYPNISSESADTLLSLNKGLDRCADLLYILSKSPQHSTTAKKVASLRKNETEGKLESKNKIKGSLHAKMIEVLHTCIEDFYHNFLTLNRTPSELLKTKYQFTPNDKKKGYKKRVIVSTPLASNQKCLNSSSKIDEKEANSHHKKVVLRNAPIFETKRKVFENKSSRSILSKTDGVALQQSGEKTSKEILVEMNSSEKHIMDAPLTNELQDIVGRITSKLSIDHYSTTHSEFSQHNITQPKLQNCLNESVENLHIPTAATSLVSSFESKKDINNPMHGLLTIRNCINSVNFMMNDLRKILENSINLQVCSTLDEIDHMMSMMSFAANQHEDKNKSKVFSLTKENVELKRQLDVTLKELNIFENEISRKMKMYQDYIAELENQIKLEDDSKQDLSKQVADVAKLTSSLRQENQTLLRSLSEKEKKHGEEIHTLLNEKSMLLKESQQSGRLIDQLKSDIQSFDKEKSLNMIAIKQRDVEIARLTQLNRDLQESVSKLLVDMNVEDLRLFSQHNGDNHIKKTRFVNDDNSRQQFNHDNRSRSTRQQDFPSLLLNTQTVSNDVTLSCDSTDDQILQGTVSTLTTLDNSEFRKGLDQLDFEIERVQKLFTKNF